MTEPRRLDHLPLGGEGGLPYSKGLLARALMATGLSSVHAWELALRVEADLELRRETSVDLERLEELAQDVLGESEGVDAVRRLRRYRELQGLDLPIVVLVGGGTGTGKSRVATEIAYRLGITRVTSTDFIRQTMRAFFSEEFMPSIHYSSFEAGPAAPEADDPTLAGFLDQTRNVLVGVRAVIERALHEGWSMVLEGVHLVPGSCRPSRARSRCNACSRSRARTSTPATSGCATRPPRACGRSGATSSSWTRSGVCRASSSIGRVAATCR